MRVEQRIGRIDRLGQRFDRIRILNLHYEDTVEADVYSALRQRIQLFTRFVSRLQPILARLPAQFAAVALAPGASRAAQREAILRNLEADVVGRERDPTRSRRPTWGSRYGRRLPTASTSSTCCSTCPRCFPPEPT
jgi:hypothetical protein